MDEIRARRRARKEDQEAPTRVASERHRLESRKDHVKDVLLVDHAELIAWNPLGFDSKLQQLTVSPSTFFRGAPGLFYRELAGTDMDRPRVLGNGDPHPDNFGIQAGSDGKPVFGLNDFDEAWPAPFSWDLKRAAVGFELLARERGLSSEKRDEMVRELVRGYRDAVEAQDKAGRGKPPRWIHEELPKPIRKQLKKAEEQSRVKFLESAVRMKTGRFRDTDQLTPASERIADVQAAMDEYVRGLPAESRPRPSGFFRVKDVAVRVGSGTDNLGMDRYWVLVEGRSSKPEDDLVLELKEINASALAPYAGGASTWKSEAERVVDAQRVQMPAGDPMYGATHLRDSSGQPASFLVRERSPQKESIDWEALDRKDLRDTARLAGVILAEAHIRSAGSPSGRAELTDEILSSMKGQGLPSEIARFSANAADQVEADYRDFLKLRYAGELNAAQSER